MTNAEPAQAVDELAAGKRKWARLPLQEKIDYLDQLRSRVLGVSREWVGLAVRAKGIRPGSPLEGEEWMSGPYAVLWWLDAVTQTLKAIDGGRDPLRGLPIRQRADGQTIIRVAPHDLAERLLLHGFSSEVWMEPGVTSRTLRDGIGLFITHPDHDGKIALVLGAGNIASIPALDVLYKLYADGEVVVLKMNPVNDYLGSVLERAFAPLVDGGFLRFAYGGGDVGHALCTNPDVDSIHITGSAHTHDMIIYGPGPKGAARKARDERLLDKPITSELGGVGPTIVVPGPWTRADFRFQGEHIATQKLHNSGFNCVASQVVVLPREWDGVTPVVDALRRSLQAAPGRPAYYPGADQRRETAAKYYPGAERLTAGGATRTLIVGADATDAGSYAFTEEFFAPALATTALPGRDAKEFLRNAVAFANDTLAGTLGANIVIHPRSIAELGPAFEDAIADLRYGTVAINAWTAVAYLNPRAIWGAFPGHTLSNIQSGIGVVHNALLLDRPQKTVVRGAFRPFPRSVAQGEFTIMPRPPWFVTNRTAHITGRRLTDYAADGKLKHLPGIFASALRG